MIRLWLGVALGLGLGGCGDDSDAGRIHFCGGLCAGMQRCGLTDSECGTRCLANFEAHGERESGLGVVGDCLRNERCDILAGDKPFDSCFDQAAKQEPLRPALKSYCESASLNDFRCNVFWPVEDCVHSMGLWDDATLQSAQSCHERSCETRDACESGVFKSR